jgi:Ulp1 family protease
VLLKILENQQENNGYDCGLFAIANLVNFVLMMQPITIKTNLF